MIQLAFLLAVTTLTVTDGLRTRLHMRLQADPDVACQQWLNSTAGQQFVQCDTGNPGIPVPFNQSNNCQITSADFDTYCNDPCVPIVVKGYTFFLQTGTCLPVYEDKYKPCMNDTDCNNALGDGIARVCSQGFCYTNCTSNNDCNACLGETCNSFGQSQGCQSNQTYHLNGSATSNRTIENTIRGWLYSFQAGCSKNINGLYCSLMDLSNQTCDSLISQWGCCANTILPSMQYCQWTNFTNSNMASLFNCNFTGITPCGNLTDAQQFCQPATNTSSNSSSSSSSSSSSGSSSSSMSSSSMSSMSSSSMSSSSPNIIISGSSGLTASPSGVGNSGNSGNSGSGAAGLTASWMTVALVIAAAHFIS